jgi:hypothetical protein
MFANHHFSILALLLSSILLFSGCQLTDKPEKSNTSYGEYYLFLQQLTEAELADEVSNIQNKTAIVATQMLNNDDDSQIKLLLLYSFPKSPIYSSFNAKALLNQMKLESNNAVFANITPSEQALITLLRDQLNQQLLMRNRLIAQQTEQKKQQEKQQKIALQTQQKLIKQIALLEQTIAQLKKIDQAIDNREQ